MSVSSTHTAVTQPAIAKSDWTLDGWTLPQVGCSPMRRGVDFLATPRSNGPRSNRTAAAPIVGDPS